MASGNMTKNSGSGKTFGGLGIVPEILTEDNYEQWKRCLHNYLVGQGLWSVVSGKEPEPDKVLHKQEHDLWKQKNALALHAIQLSCGAGIYAKFERAHLKANYAWTHLAEKALTLKQQQQQLSSDHEDQEDEDKGTTQYLKYRRFYEAIEEGNMHKTQEILNQTRTAVKARISSHNDTALHIAILSGHMKIAEHLVSLMEPNDLEMINDYGATCLSLAAVCGETKLAKKIVRKNKHLVKMKNEHEDGHLPVIVAALYGQKHMVHYLYEVTPKSELSPDKGEDGVTLLNCLITAEIYDVASMLLRRYPKLGVIPDESGHYALKILAQKPSAFPSGTKFAVWEKLIYHSVRIHSPWDEHDQEYFHTEHHNDHLETNDQITIEVQELSDEEIDMTGNGGSSATSTRVHNIFHKLGWWILRGIVPEVKYIHHRKLVHDESVKLLGCMFQEMRTLSKSELEKMDIDSIIYDAIKHGIVEFIKEMLRYNPEIIWKKDKKGRTIFSHAIVLRQEKIFSLIHDLGTKKNIMARRHDAFRNNYLHLAAKLSPPQQLQHVSGAALQMQSELQWYKEVESIVQPKLKEEFNENNKTPETLFTDEHQNLMKEAEDWMKYTAGSSMVVGTLIAAVMFTTAFTIPGGNKNENGQPIMLETQPHPFLIFMVSNALSLFSSSTSMLMFLGILTARYAEEDFLKSLPTKLIFGLTCLFVSIVTMLSSFGAALYLILHESLSWVTIPIIVFSVIPIVLFSICQFPLLIEMSYRTYWSGIFDKPKKGIMECFK